MYNFIFKQTPNRNGKRLIPIRDLEDGENYKYIPACPHKNSETLNSLIVSTLATSSIFFPREFVSKGKINSR